MDNRDNRLKKKVFSGLIWTFGQRILTQGISFVLSVLLARMLMPEEYGIISMVLVFINIANVFVLNGFGESLVQKKDASEEDFSTIFYCSSAVSLLLYGLLFLLAPWIAFYYESPDLLWVLRILALQLPIASVSTIQQAYVQKHMQFQKLFFSTLGGTLVSGVLGILMAYWEYGVWALVAQYLTNSLISMIVMFFTVSWKPRLVFRAQSASALFRYAWKLTVASLINTVYNELRSLIIGKQYSVADLAYYSKGNSLPSLAITNVNSAISTVVFPALAQVNDDPQHMKALSRRAMKLSAYIIFPVMAGLIGVGEPLIRLLLTDKWMGAVPFLYLNCVYWAFQPVQTANWQIIKAMGRSDLALKLEVYKKIIGFTLILASMPFGVMALASTNVLFAFISMLINIAPNKKLIRYSYTEQFRDLAPSLAASAIMCLLVLRIGRLPLGDFFLIVVQIIAGVGIYIALSAIFRIDSFYYIWDIVKNLWTKLHK